MLRTAFVLSFLALAPAAAQAAPVRVVASVETLAALARAVGGDAATVETLSRGYQDPHHVEAKPNLLVTLNRADLLLFVGLDLEAGWLPPLVSSSGNAKIQPGSSGSLDASQLIEILDVPAGKVDRSQGDIHPRGNPHYWLDPVNAVKIARAIAERLGQIDPSNAAAFQKNLEAFAADLKGRAPGWSQRAAALKGLKVVTYHRSWTYLARWVGLAEVGTIEDKPGIAPNPRHLAELIGQMKAQGARLILVESYYNRSIAAMVADKAGARLVVLPPQVGATPEITTYPQLIDAILDALTTAKGG